MIIIDKICISAPTREQFMMMYYSTVIMQSDDQYNQHDQYNQYDQHNLNDALSSIDD